jgi:outer membrane protein OmpA-like peptidoglycan-associated protein
MKPYQISFLLRAAQCLLLTGAIFTQNAIGEEYIGSQTLSEEQVIELLKLPTPETTGNQTGFNTRSINKRPKETAASNEKDISMQVKFDYNSTNLTDHAKQQLTPLGKALASPALRDQRFVVEGHTDSKGNPDYNQRLSERRAASVRRFLITQYKLDPPRIKAIGWGETMPLDPANPESEVNRRVKIVTYR